MQITTSQKEDDLESQFSDDINNSRFIEIKGLKALEIEIT